MKKVHKPSNRIAKMNSLIQQLANDAVRKYTEGEAGLITISKVETSPDMKWAKVWISIVGGDDDSILRTINKNIFDIQGDVNKRLEIKIFPRLQFFLDTSPRYAQHIDELIQEIHKEEE